MVRKPGKLGGAPAPAACRRFVLAAFPRVPGIEGRAPRGGARDPADRGRPPQPRAHRQRGASPPRLRGAPRGAQCRSRRGLRPPCASVRDAMARAYSIRQASGLRSSRVAISANDCSSRLRRTITSRCSSDSSLQGAFEAERLLVHGDAARLGPDGGDELADLCASSSGTVRRVSRRCLPWWSARSRISLRRDAREPRAEGGRALAAEGLKAREGLQERRSGRCRRIRPWAEERAGPRRRRDGVRGGAGRARRNRLAQAASRATGVPRSREEGRSVIVCVGRRWRCRQTHHSSDPGSSPEEPRSPP